MSGNRSQSASGKYCYSQSETHRIFDTEEINTQILTEKVSEHIRKELFDMLSLSNDSEQNLKVATVYGLIVPRVEMAVKNLINTDHNNIVYCGFATNFAALS